MKVEIKESVEKWGHPCWHFDKCTYPNCYCKYMPFDKLQERIEETETNKLSLDENKKTG